MNIFRYSSFTFPIRGYATGMVNIYHFEEGREVMDYHEPYVVFYVQDNTPDVTPAILTLVV